MSVENPTNEQETIYRFIKICEPLGFSINNFWTSYPDATIIDVFGFVYRVEFEYKLSSFIKHGHNPRDCDLVVCWKDDVTKIQFPLTVWELSTESYPSIQLPTEEEFLNFQKFVDGKIKRPSKGYTGDGEGLFDNLIKRLNK